MKRALVLSLICVLGLAFTGLAATLSGSWDTDVTILPQQTDFNDAITLTSVLTVQYDVGDWMFKSITTLDQDGWTDQDFSVTGVLGAFVIGSDLGFIPATAAFDSWITTVDVSIAGVSFGSTFELDGSDAFLTLTGSGVAGDVVVEVTVDFGDDGVDGCDLNWTGIVIGVDFPFDCAFIESTLTFSCDGFESIVFGVEGIGIPTLPWVTLDATLTFTMDAKSLTLTPAFDFGTIVCFTLDMDMLDSGGTMETLNLGDIIITGIGLEVDFGAVTFTGHSSFIAGEGEYWESYIISTEADACCGGLFEFDLGFYFLQGGIRLFDIALIDVDLVVNITEQFKFNMGLEVDVEGVGFTEWTVGFLVTW